MMINIRFEEKERDIKDIEEFIGELLKNKEEYCLIYNEDIKEAKFKLFKYTDEEVYNISLVNPYKFDTVHIICSIYDCSDEEKEELINITDLKGLDFSFIEPY